MKQPEPKPQAANYTQYYALEATGWRIGLVTCRRCGAALIVGGDGKDNAVEIHDRWHER